MPLVMTAAQLAFIAHAAESAFPGECCGLLIGRAAGRGRLVVSRLVPAPNLLAQSAHDRFELDPATRFQAERMARQDGQQVIGHWHSHPDGSALPSATDLDQAWEPQLVWVIAGVATAPDGRPQTVQILAHRLDRERAKSRPMPLVLAEKNACATSGFPT